MVYAKTILSVECHAGFILNGFPQLICYDSETWFPNPNQLSCIEESSMAKCSNVTEPSNGKLSRFSGDGQVGTKLVVNCESGFQLEGAAESMCVIGDGGPKWFPDLGNCQPEVSTTPCASDNTEEDQIISCSVPNSGDNGKFIIAGSKFDFEPRTVFAETAIALKCNDGFIPISFPHSMCYAQDKWFPEPASCMEIPKGMPMMPGGPMPPGMGMPPPPMMQGGPQGMGMPPPMLPCNDTRPAVSESERSRDDGTESDDGSGDFTVITRRYFCNSDFMFC